VRVLLHHNKRRFSWLFGVILIAIIATGCSSNRWGFPYMVGLQQGNWVTQQQVGLLYEGMTREQVRFALGSPTLTSVLHADRWEYPYFLQVTEWRRRGKTPCSLFFRWRPHQMAR